MKDTGYARNPVSMKQEPKILTRALDSSRMQRFHLHIGSYGRRDIMTSACTLAYTIIPSSAYGYTGKYLRKLDWTVRGCECQLPLVSDTSDLAKTQPPAGILLAFNGPPSKHPQSLLAFDLPYPDYQCLVHGIPSTSLQWMMLCPWKARCYPEPLPLTDFTCTFSL